MSPTTRQRALAASSLVLLTAAPVVAVAAVIGDVGRLLAAVVLVGVVVAAAWDAATHRSARRAVGAVVAVVGLGALVAVGITAEGRGLGLVLVVALVAASLATGHRAVEHQHGGPPAGLRLVPPAERPALIVNLRSGGGKAESTGLVEVARARGIEVSVLEPGLDLRRLAVDAIERGADVIGMAGGDGSQALVADVASEHGVSHVCIPAGTRNHFALDLGLDRDDVLGALDAYGPALERTIDLATAGDRVFVNNVSLGVYAEIVQSPEYRDAKAQTTAALVPDLLGPDGPPFDLHFEGPDGTEHHGDQVVQVSNNPYVITRPTAAFGTRARIDTGTLGVVALKVRGAADVSRMLALEAIGRIGRFEGWSEWTTPELVIHSDTPILAGVDGEALVFDPPLVLRSKPAALRVRIPVGAPGRSPAARLPGSAAAALRALVDVARGRTPAAAAMAADA